MPFILSRRRDGQPVTRFVVSSSVLLVERAGPVRGLRALLTVTSGQRRVQDCPGQTVESHMQTAVFKQLFLKPE